MSPAAAPLRPLFRPGQEVYLFYSHDDRGTISVGQFVVRSCGFKQMHLVDTFGDNAGFRTHVAFAKAPAHGRDVVAVADCPDPTAHALALGAKFLEGRRAHLESRLAQFGADAPFVANIRHELARLHEPRVTVPATQWVSA